MWIPLHFNGTDPGPPETQRIQPGGPDPLAAWPIEPQVSTSLAPFVSLLALKIVRTLLCIHVATHVPMESSSSRNGMRANAVAVATGGNNSGLLVLR